MGSYYSRRGIEVKRRNVKKDLRRKNNAINAPFHENPKFMSKQEERRRANKKPVWREEVQNQQLKARKENTHHRIKHLIHPIDYHRSSSDYFYDDAQEYKISQEILPAQDLGIDDGSMYERLLDILEGDEICPEDYELLLQLDNNNVKKSTLLKEDSIEKIPVMIIGEGRDEEKKDNDDGRMISIKDIEQDHCEICLEPWRDNTQVRQLPCNHVFCKNCIDYWLKEVSHKCPSLCCYWCKED